MTWIIELFFGPTVPENPNYEIIQDVTSLFPWWYPPFVMACMVLFLTLLWAAHRKKFGDNFPGQQHCDRSAGRLIPMTPDPNRGREPNRGLWIKS